MKGLIEYIAKSLVDEPEDVEVTEIEGEQSSVLELTVAQDDLGKVIGKKGLDDPGHAEHLERRGDQGGQAGHAGDHRVGPCLRPTQRRGRAQARRNPWVHPQGRRHRLGELKLGLHNPDSETIGVGTWSLGPERRRGAGLARCGRCGEPLTPVSWPSKGW